jgi:arsenical pump membrane protein
LTTSMPLTSQLAIWGIAGLATAGVILRPLHVPQAVWALSGAAALVCLGLLPVSAAVAGIGRGVDVYLFLAGMMLLAELARQEGLFDWLAARAACMARGSARRLFGLVYIVGIVVTVFLSNDATAVVLTPAVAAVARAAKVERPLPYLFICAFIANAASFVLPISNPANLVIYGNRMPALLQWLPRFALPSLMSIGATYILLRWTQRDALRQSVALHVTVPALSSAGKLTAAGIAATAVALILASALGIALGAPTCAAGLVTLGAVALTLRSAPWRFVRGVSWGVIPLVAGLFVLVEALERSGVIHSLGALLRGQAEHAATLTAAGAGVAIGVAANLINNLPAGLIAGSAVQSADLAPQVASAILVGVDLGPNLSVTGSLATILWLGALRRDGIQVKAWDFLKLGLLIMPPALALALGGLLLAG